MCQPGMGNRADPRQQRQTPQLCALPTPQEVLPHLDIKGPPNNVDHATGILFLLYSLFVWEVQTWKKKKHTHPPPGAED